VKILARLGQAAVTGLSGKMPGVSTRTVPMRLLTLVLAMAMVAASCGSKDDADHARPTSSFSTPSDGSARIPQGTVEYATGGLQVGVGGVTKDPDGAILSVMKSGAQSVYLVLDVGEKGTAFGHTVTVTAIEFGDHDYAWVKVSPA
jgi:hypothetical protein